MKIIIYYLFLLLLPVVSFAQKETTDLTGVWKGTFYVDSTKKTYPYELSISDDKGKLSGYSRISFEEDGVMQTVFRDHKIKRTDDGIVIEDDNQLAKASSVAQPREVKKTMQMQLIVKDSSMELTGTWSTNKTRRFLTATGTATLQRKKDFRTTALYQKLDELSLTDKLSFSNQPEEDIPGLLEKRAFQSFAKIDIVKKEVNAPVKIRKPNPAIKPYIAAFALTEKPKPAIVKVAIEPEKKPVTATTPVIKQTEPVIAKATTETVKAPVTSTVVRKNILPEAGNAALDVSNRAMSTAQVLYFRSDSLQLTLYDNGEIDGDTVSVLLNGKVIIARKGLDLKPNSFTIYFDRDSPDSQMLVMYAENLGSIPPNTGLLVVKEGKSVHEVRFSADLKSNAAIILRRRKEE